MNVVLAYQKFVILFVLILGMVASSCATKEAIKTKANTLSGVVQLVGNDPFTQVAIHSSDGTVYRIVTPKEIENRLRKMQGMKVTVVYSSMTTTVEGPVIAVINIEE